MRKVIYLIAFMLTSLSCATSLAQERECEYPQRTFFVGRSYKGPEVNKTIPLYKFKKDLRGDFLEQFCDTLAKHDGFSILTLNEVQDLHIPYEGTPKDYIYLQSEFMDSTLFHSMNGAVTLSGKELLLFRNVSDSTLAELHMDRIGSLNIRYGVPSDNCFPYINDSELRALLHLRSDGSVDPVLIYLLLGSINKYPSLATHFDWIKAFYSENGINLSPSYLKQRDLFEYIFYDDSIPREEYYENGKLSLIFSFNDILRIKNWRFPFDKALLPIVNRDTTGDN